MNKIPCWANAALFVFIDLRYRDIITDRINEAKTIPTTDRPTFPEITLLTFLLMI